MEPQLSQGASGRTFEGQILKKLRLCATRRKMSNVSERLNSAFFLKPDETNPSTAEILKAIESSKQLRAKIEDERKPIVKEPIKVNLGLQERLQRAAAKSSTIPATTKKEEAKPTASVSGLQYKPETHQSSLVVNKQVESAKTLRDLAQAVEETRILMPLKPNAPPTGISIFPIKGYSKLQQRIDCVRGLRKEVARNKNPREPRSSLSSGVSSSSSMSDNDNSQYQNIYDRLTKLVDSSTCSIPPGPSDVASTGCASADEMPSNPLIIYNGMMPTVHLIPEVQQHALQFSQTCLQNVAAHALTKLTPEQQNDIQHLTTFEPKDVPKLFESFVQCWQTRGIPLDIAAVETFMMTRGFYVVNVPVLFVNQ